MPKTNSNENNNNLSEISSLQEIRNYIESQLAEVRCINYLERLKDEEYRVVRDWQDPLVIGQYIAYKILADILARIGIEEIAVNRDLNDPRDSFRNTGETFEDPKIEED